MPKLLQGFNGQKSDDERKVHSGFFAAAAAVSRRVKELLVSATAGKLQRAAEVVTLNWRVEVEVVELAGARGGGKRRLR